MKSNRESVRGISVRVSKGDERVGDRGVVKGRGSKEAEVWE